MQLTAFLRAGQREAWGSDPVPVVVDSFMVAQGSPLLGIHTQGNGDEQQRAEL